MGTIPEGYLKPRDAASGGAVASYPLSLLLRPPADDLASLAGRPPHSIINRGVHKQQGINPGPQFDETSFFNEDAFLALRWHLLRARPRQLDLARLHRNLPSSSLLQPT